MHPRPASPRRTALLGDNEGALRLVDVRAGRVQGRPLTVHRKKINTVHLEPTQEQVERARMASQPASQPATNTSLPHFLPPPVACPSPHAAHQPKPLVSRPFRPPPPHSCPLPGSLRQVCATSSTDTSIQLWDMRKLAPGKPLAAAGHAQGCQAAMFAPDGAPPAGGGSQAGRSPGWLRPLPAGHPLCRSRRSGVRLRLPLSPHSLPCSVSPSLPPPTHLRHPLPAAPSSGSRRLVSTSFDNTLRIWDGASGLAPLRTIKHDNNTGRWVLPFRAVWNAAGDGVIVGEAEGLLCGWAVWGGWLVQRGGGGGVRVWWDLLAEQSLEVDQPGLRVMACRQHEALC